MQPRRKRLSDRLPMISYRFTDARQLSVWACPEFGEGSANICGQL